MIEEKIKAHAKINLSLDITGKRSDGYHEVKMIMQAIDINDIVTIKKISSGIIINTNLNYLPSDENNLAYKAAHLFLKEIRQIDKTGFEISIEKKIPVSAGLAGGSSDAAAVLTTLNKIYNNIFDKDKLLQLGGEIGSDVPFCILGGTALAEGRGEKVTSLNDIPETVIVVAKPPVHVSTAQIYNDLVLEKINFHPDTKKILKFIKEENIYGIAKNMYNVLESVTSKKHTIINRIKNILKGNGALGAIMSGSGPSVFGLFDNKVAAYNAVNKLKTIVPDVFVTKTVNKKNT